MAHLSGIAFQGTGDGTIKLLKCSQSRGTECSVAYNINLSEVKFRLLWSICVVSVYHKY